MGFYGSLILALVFGSFGLEETNAFSKNKTSLTQPHGLPSLGLLMNISTQELLLLVCLTTPPFPSHLPHFWWMPLSTPL